MDLVKPVILILQIYTPIRWPLGPKISGDIGKRSVGQDVHQRDDPVNAAGSKWMQAASNSPMSYDWYDGDVYSNFYLFV